MTLPLFYIKDVSLTIVDKPLFTNISAKIHAKDRICLVGKNGSGKSTLLKIMAGEIEADKGEIYHHPGIKIGLLAQQPLFKEDMKVYDYVLQNITTEVTRQEKSYLADIILEKLQLSGDKYLSKLSGGKLRRADLARVLITEPDLLFLDEPTNHLDISSIEWLEDYLNNFSGGVILVSHDRAFLRNISNKTIWLDRGNLIANNKGYSDFDRWSEEIFEKETKMLSKLGKELDKENLWLAQGVTARRKRNQQRLSKLYELRSKLKNEKSRFNKIDSNIKLDLLSPLNKSKLLLEIENVAFKFTDMDPPKEVFKPFSLHVMKGETIGVMGRNGAGKSTLVKLITGKLNPTEGSIKFGANLEYSYLDQSRSEIDHEKTLWETLCPNGGDTVFIGDKPKHVVAYLKDFLFDSKQANSKTSTLSGGEQNRLLLAKLLLNPGNFLILDEPTNDLDIDTLDMLVEILSEYKGSLLIVSHDRDFIDRLATRIIIIDQPNVYDHVGGYYDYISAEKPMKSKIQKSDVVREASKEIKKLSYKEEYELSLLPEKIDNLTSLINKLEAELNNSNLYNEDIYKFHEISNNLNKKHKELNQAETRWLELEAKKIALLT